ncbi:MAG TPA: hypothetical protein DD000_21805, partial [Cyanobacteria bacterium UBA11166]|nr:hypothetical protein [Cyanobacteria bacterium UBA11166]
MVKTTVGLSQLTENLNYMKKLPIILTKAEVNKYHRQKVIVIGKYTQKDVRYNPFNLSPPIYEGNVAVILPDGTGVYLYPTWHKKAIRPAKEIAMYENHLVAIVGIISKSIPDPPNSRYPIAKLLSPCTLTIDAIELYKNARQSIHIFRRWIIDCSIFTEIA